MISSQNVVLLAFLAFIMTLGMIAVLYRQEFMTVQKICGVK